MEKEPVIGMGRNKGRRTLDRLGGFSTSIGADNVFKGSLSGVGHCVVLGRVEGDSVLDGTVVLTKGAYWVGNLEAENVVIAGQVKGSVTARRKLEIVSTAEIDGTLHAPYIVIAEGAVHRGEIHMAEVKRIAEQRTTE
jgi:cytoskeletal protein CcmA (bactofilin family)